MMPSRLVSKSTWRLVTPISGGHRRAWRPASVPPRNRFASDSPLEEEGFEPPVPPNCFETPLSDPRLSARAASGGGTKSSNPCSSSAESGANLILVLAQPMPRARSQVSKIVAISPIWRARTAWSLAGRQGAQADFYPRPFRLSREGRVRARAGRNQFAAAGVSPRAKVWRRWIATSANRLSRALTIR